MLEAWIINHLPLWGMGKIESKKMTREEAKKKFMNASVVPNVDVAEVWIKRLEALGLLKFEEKTSDVNKEHSSEKGGYVFFPNPDSGKDNVGVLKHDLAETLNKYGYTLTKEENQISPSWVIHNYFQMKGMHNFKFTMANEIINALMKEGYKIVLDK